MRGERFFGCLRGCIDTMASMIAQGSTARCTILTFNETIGRVYDGPVSSEAMQALRETESVVCEGKTRYFDVMTSLIRQRLKQTQDESGTGIGLTFVVATDGHDTASTLCTSNTLRQAVEEARKDHAWEFKYIGIAHDTMGAEILRGQAAATGFCPEDTYCTDSVLDVPQLVREASGAAGTQPKPLSPIAPPNKAFPCLAFCARKPSDKPF